MCKWWGGGGDIHYNFPIVGELQETGCKREVGEPPHRSEARRLSVFLWCGGWGVRKGSPTGIRGLLVDINLII